MSSSIYGLGMSSSTFVAHQMFACKKLAFIVVLGC